MLNAWGMRGTWVGSSAGARAAAVFAACAAAVSAAPAQAGPADAAFAVTAPTTRSDPGCSVRNSGNPCVVVKVDHLRPIKIGREANAVLIGNPGTADVQMISRTQAVVTARTVGSTNLFFLDERGDIIDVFDVVVKEPESQRVVMRRGPGGIELLQCAPRCERTLSQIDDFAKHDQLQTIINNDFKVNQKGLDFGEGGETEGAE